MKVLSRALHSNMPESSLGNEYGTNQVHAFNRLGAFFQQGKGWPLTLNDWKQELKSRDSSVFEWKALREEFPPVV